jgi:AcrR family transcriptional regulator
MARKTRRDWFMAGVLVLAEQGAAALTIEALLQRLAVTKGSFYHHFEHWQAYKTALLEFIEQAGTQQIIERVEAQATTPRAKLNALIAIIDSDAPRLEVGLRAWALQDAQVREFQARIDQQRLQYVENLCLALPVPPDQARVMTHLLYVILIGSEQTIPPIVGADLRRLFAEYQRLYHL